jgi:tRNA A37 threonylcarbamoyladenosine modification protein TsaB
LIGVYRDNKLVDKIESEGKISDILLDLVEEQMKKYSISSIIYTRGPGSHMATKLTYIMLKTIEIVNKIPIYGSSAFLFNANSPIKAIGKLYFTKEADTIVTKKFNDFIPQIYTLPSSLVSLKTDDNSMPDYILPAVDTQVKANEKLCS